jgi:LmbE family N-acetylglucosaminyl deacetylase
MVERVLVIAPHTDDEVLGAGGTIVKHVNDSHHVHVCFISLRQTSSKRTQYREAKEAKEVLGYQEVTFLDLPDSYLDDRVIDIVTPLEKVYNKYKPTVVYTCNGTDTNQDHQAVFKATMIVCRPHCTRVKRLLSYEVPSSTDQMPKSHSDFKPNFYNLLSNQHVLQKNMAMKKYKSELREYPNPRSLEGIEIYGKFRGLEVREDAAEAFMLLREIK